VRGSVSGPGTAYDRGYGLAVSGRVIEVISGKPFEVFLERPV